MGSVVLTAPVVIRAVMLVMVATPATEVLHREIGCLSEGERRKERRGCEGRKEGGKKGRGWGEGKKVGGKGRGKRDKEGEESKQGLAYPPFVTRTWSTPFSLNS